MAITGSQPAYAQARAGIERAGASRAGAYLYRPIVTIGTLDVSAWVIRASLHVTQAMNDTPASARFTLKPDPGGTHTAISNGQPITIGGEFGGQINRITRRYEHGVYELQRGHPTPFLDVECIDWSRLINRRIVTAHYGAQSASTIASLILQTFTSGFSGAGIQPGLPTIDDFPLTNETVTGALMRLAKLIDGEFYLGPDKVVHLFDQHGDRSPVAGTAPATLTLPMAGLQQYQSVSDGSQVRTRMVVEGKSTTLLIGTPAGATTVSVDTSGPVDYLVVAGGGAGGAAGYAGGGGAGGVLSGTDTLASGAYPIVVGPGGAASTFNGHAAVGGGAGGTNGAPGASGGSGGGGGSPAAGGACVTAQGNVGGAAASAAPVAVDWLVVGGGGGGANSNASAGGGGGNVVGGTDAITGGSFAITVGAAGGVGGTGGTSAYNAHAAAGGAGGGAASGGTGGTGGASGSGLAGGAGHAGTLTLQGACLVAGGGGGGGGTGSVGAGGGGGGVITLGAFAITAGSWAITVGAGGTGGGASTNGGNSSALGYTAIGGGRGGISAPPGNPQRAGGDGGSGGGGADNQPGGNPTAGQGHVGGSNVGTLSGAGGGGGAGAPGATVSGDVGGNGGDGVAWGPGTYGGGGGGNGAQGYGTGGSGGGGRGGAGGNPGFPGAANTGGGGGGGDGWTGGSGIVMILYTPGSVVASGGTVSSFGPYTMHTFTSSGTFTIASAASGGGGAGAGAAGGAGQITIGGAGGAGVASAITGGGWTYYGGGGGGTCDVAHGPGGIGGGGSPGVAYATPNSGGGGGAWGDPGAAGVVIVRYPTGALVASGGAIAYAGGYTVHTFTASGTWTVSSVAGAGGGGGAGAPGGAGTVSTGGAGGAGTSSSISGASVTYGGGGGGWGDAAQGQGGAGGGGNAGQAGAPNTGGGGGAYAVGGSGVVILSYLTGTITATGGAIGAVGARTVHRFTASGTFTISQVVVTAPPPLVGDLPVADPSQLSAGGGWVRLGFSTYHYVGLGGPVVPAGTNPPATNLSVDTPALSTLLNVDDATIFVSSPGWIKINDQIVRYGGSSNAAPGIVTGIPALGFGALMAAATKGTQVTYLGHVRLADLYTIAPPVHVGDSAVHVVIVDDPPAQATTAAIEGGDGVHEQGVQDGRLSPAGQFARATSELTDFDHPLYSATWTTTDRNAKAGRNQAIAIDGVTITLMITNVDVDFSIPHHDPRRTCTGSTVRAAALLDAIVTDTN